MMPKVLPFDPPQRQVTLSARVPEDLRRAVKFFCTQNDLTIQDFMIQACSNYLRGEGARTRRRKQS